MSLVRTSEDELVQDPAQGQPEQIFQGCVHLDFEKSLEMNAQSLFCFSVQPPSQ